MAPPRRQDIPNVPPTTTPVVDNGTIEFGAGDLAAAVRLDPSFLTQFQNGVTLSEKDGIKAIRNRMGDSIRLEQWSLDDDKYTKNSTTTGQDGDGDFVAQFIFKALPESLRSAEALAALDLRPYLTQLIGKPLLRVRHTDGYEVKEKIVFDFQRNATQLDKTIGDTIRSGLPSTMTEDQKNVYVQQAIKFDATRAGMNPAINPTVAEGKAKGGFDATKVNTVADIQASFPIDELRAMVATGQMKYEDLIQQENAAKDQLGGGYFPISVDGPDATQHVRTSSPTSPTPGTDTNPLRPGRTVGAMEALNMLTTMTPKEITNLQRKMAAAGYFDRTTSGSTWVEGEWNDPATTEAWRLLVTDAVVENKSVPTMLSERNRDYRDKIGQARLKNLVQTDPNYEAQIANEWARQRVGRDLTQEELAGLHQHLEELKVGRSRYLAGSENGSVDGPLPNAMGFTQSDINLNVDQQTFALLNQEAATSRNLGIRKMLGG